MRGKLYVWFACFKTFIYIRTGEILLMLWTISPWELYAQNSSTVQLKKSCLILRLYQGNFEDVYFTLYLWNTEFVSFHFDYIRIDQNRSSSRWSGVNRWIRYINILLINQLKRITPPPPNQSFKMEFFTAFNISVQNLSLAKNIPR